jgi:hypothetical protein
MKIAPTTYKVRAVKKILQLPKKFPMCLVYKCATSIFSGFCVWSETEKRYRGIQANGVPKQHFLSPIEIESDDGDISHILVLLYQHSRDNELKRKQSTTKECFLISNVFSIFDYHTMPGHHFSALWDANGFSLMGKILYALVACYMQPVVFIARHP